MWLPTASRFLYGHSSNISKTGVLVETPATAPVRTGQTVEINFPRTAALAREKGVFGRLKTGRIVRIDRENVIKDASIGVAIQFA
jgi:hypothetical protein